MAEFELLIANMNGEFIKHIWFLLFCSGFVFLKNPKSILFFLWNKLASQEKEREEAQKKLSQALMEKDQVSGDLNGMERSLGDMLKRLEKYKEVVDGYKKVRFSEEERYQFGSWWQQKTNKILFLPLPEWRDAEILRTGLLGKDKKGRPALPDTEGSRRGEDQPVRSQNLDLVLATALTTNTFFFL